MSKCNSNHFSGTTGLRNSRNSAVHNPSESDIIAERVKNLDLREHPTKQMGARRMKKVRGKVDTRTATRKEYQLLRHTERLNARREVGVAQFWNQERERILNGQRPTRPWSAEQREMILGKTPPKINGKTLQGHHTYAVSKYPHLANRGEVIFPVTFYEHLNIWHGGSFFKNAPGRPVKTAH